MLYLQIISVENELKAFQYLTRRAGEQVEVSVCKYCECFTCIADAKLYYVNVHEVHLLDALLIAHCVSSR